MAPRLSARERGLLLLAALVALAFAGAAALSAARGLYRDRQAAIGDIELALAREERLLAEADRWRGRRLEAEAAGEAGAARLFTGGTVPLIEAAIQSDLSRHARESGLMVGSTRLAERLEAPGWLMISQEMSWRAVSADSVIRFLSRLERSGPELHVREFSLERGRTQYSGAVTVVGFARGPGGAGP